MSSIEPEDSGSAAERIRLQFIQSILETQKKSVSDSERNKLARYRPYPKQREFHNMGADKDERLLSAGNQLGKVQHEDCKLLTPAGWTRMGDIRPGDQVIGGDGRPCAVTAVYPHKDWEFWRVTFDEGVSTLCGMEHLWRVKQGRKTRDGVRLFRPDWEVKSLEHIIYDGGENLRPVNRPVIPVAEWVRFKPRTVTIDPWCLGALLGDGSMTHGVSFTSADRQLVDQMATQYALTDVGSYGWNLRVSPIREQLQAYGLYGRDSFTKFVPDDYLWNAPEIRLAVLQGLLDTGGSVSADGAIEYSTVSDRLADDVTFLVRSFGGKVKRERRQTQYTYLGERRRGAPSWRLRIRLPQVTPFTLKRKVDRLLRPVSTCDERVMYEVSYWGRGDGACISVDSPDNTYVTDDFIVTHNTIAGAHETAIHLTGRYPAWWAGRRWKKQVRAWVGGETGQVVRDTSQKLLLGDLAAGMANLGSGIIPAECIVDITWSRGVAQAVDMAVVRHECGKNSVLRFKSYDQGRQKWQGDTIDFVWFDEEPPEDVYSEGLARFTATKGMGFMTFTPLRGMSTVVKRFKNEKTALRGEVIMAFKDAYHLTLDDLEKLKSKYPEHEHDTRIHGVPMQGEGRIYAMADSVVSCAPFEIPAYWTRIVGLDLGHGEHPTAAVWMAINRDTDTWYVYRTYRQKGAQIAVHASAIKSGGEIPVAWPMDAHQGDRLAGTKIKDHYAKEGCLMLPTHAQYPDGSNSVWAGITEIQQRALQGKFKVFSTCNEWFEEFRMYHLEDNQIVKVDDDLLDATRYAGMMARMAKTVGHDRLRAKPKPGSLVPGADFDVLR